jgi:hypothetical protein
MWAKFDKGVQQAEITILDPRAYESVLIDEWLDQRAEPGIDFDQRTLNEEVGLFMLRLSPLSIASHTPFDFYFEQMAFDGRFPPDSDIEFNEFSPADIKRRAGGRLRDATVLAARAHAMLSPSERREMVAICSRASNVPFGTRRALLARMCRIFDIDHPNSVPILNEFSERVSHAAGMRNAASVLRGAHKMVSESDSRNVDHIQAADMAAG